MKQTLKQYSLAVCALVAITLPVHALDINVVAGAATATIQSAIDQVSAAGGGNVNLAAGGYNLTAPLNIKSNVTLNGAGTPATTIATSVDGITMIQMATEGLSSVTIQNMKLVGNGKTLNDNGIIISAQTTYHTNMVVSNVQVMNCGDMGILMKRVHGIKILNCNIHDCGSHTLMHNMYLRESTDMTVSGCQLKNSPGGTGLHIAGVCTNLTVSACTVTGNGVQGINVQDTPSTITIKNNTISNNGLTTGVEGLGFTGTSALIDSNICNNNGGYGMYLFGGSGTLSNNTATGNALGTYNVHGTWTQLNNH